MTAPTSPNAPEPSANATPVTPSSTPDISGVATGGNDLDRIVPPGPGVPSWAEGRPLREVLSISGKLEDVVRTFNQQGQIPQPVQSRQAEPAPVPSAFGDDDYLTGRQVKEFANQWATQSLAPQIEQVQRLAAQGTYAMARERHKDVFQKYGPEVDAALANIPPNQWTLQTLDRVVKFVQSEHLDELVETKARERAQQLAQEMGSSGLRSSGAPGGGLLPNQNTQAQHTLADPSIPAAWRDAAEKAGVTEGMIDGYCRATGTSRQDFFKQFASGAIRSDGGR